MTTFGKNCLLFENGVIPFGLENRNSKRLKTPQLKLVLCHAPPSDKIGKLDMSYSNSSFKIQNLDIIVTGIYSLGNMPLISDKFHAWFRQILIPQFSANSYCQDYR